MAYHFDDSYLRGQRWALNAVEPEDAAILDEFRRLGDGVDEATLRRCWLLTARPPLRARTPTLGELRRLAAGVRSISAATDAAQRWAATASTIEVARVVAYRVAQKGYYPRDELFRSTTLGEDVAS